MGTKLKAFIATMILMVYVSMPVFVMAKEAEEEITKSISETTKVEEEYGKVKIEIALRMPMETPNLTISLKKGSLVIGTPEIKFENKVANYHFSKVENGVYQLSIKGPNYITYTQTVEVKNDITNIKLSNSHEVNDIQKTQYGVIGYGDITGDGKINQEDEKRIISYIEKEKYDVKYDLNGDGKLDIIDLSYIVLNQKENTIAVPIKTLNTDIITVEKSENTVLEKGEIQNILEGKGYVSLAPKTSEEISEGNPVELTLDLSKNTRKTEGITIESASAENAIKNGVVTVTYLDEDGTEKTIEVVLVKSRARSALRVATAATATIESDGTIVINLNGQIAIKKVTIKVTETGSNKLADIAKVEFLNNMQDRIPAPTMDIPTNLIGIPASKKFTVTWQAMPNITGYEVSITNKGIEEKVKTTTNRLEVKSFKEDKIKNGTKFSVKVQSLNGEWRSGYSEAISVTPKADKVPDAPENINIVGAYKALNVSWKDMEDTENYVIYYRKKGETAYKNTEKILTNKYTLSNLENKTEYELYIVGYNEIGKSNPSAISIGKTIALEPTITPNYRLINTSNGDGEVTAHIKDVIYSNGWDSTTDGKFSIVDNNYASYWEALDWDSGAHYAQKAPIIEFDKAYEMDRIIIVVPNNFAPTYSGYRLNYWDEQGNKKSVEVKAFVKKADENENYYYTMKMAEPIKAVKVQPMVSTYGSFRLIQYTEIKFYYYDSIENDISHLFADDMHVTLKEMVTLETIKTLQQRLDTKDDVSGEYHPDREMLQKELDYAKQILQDKKLDKVIQVNTTISSKYDSHLSMSGGLNAWQPLEITAAEKETIVIYVGGNGKKVGDTAPINIYATQLHGESGVWQTSLGSLKIGRNEIAIPKISSMVTEHGGSIYFEYTGNNKNDQYAIRVSGGNKIPTLNLAGVTDETAKRQKITEYVEALEAYVPTMEKLHNENHKVEGGTCNYEYDEKNCIYNATEILIDKMMYSVPAKQIQVSLKGTIAQKVEQLYQSLEAMDKMVSLFYEHKGLSNSGEAGVINRIPSKHLNIRYHRMFAGAFMYAGGLHIGIEWDSVIGLTNSVPVESTEQGKYISGNYFGWGIAHEIGHIINEGTYAIAEITNNYYSILAQAKDTNESIRISYNDVYSKVTSGTTGIEKDFQVAMYWQLHLAYDKGGYNYKTYNSYTEQFNNVFMARVDTYVRDTSKAPAPKGIPLTLSGDKNNKFMRLSVAAANKNILEFFEKWGLIPDETTKAYAEQFEKETRPIYYVSDAARVYELEGKPSIAAKTKVTANLSNETNSKQVKIALSNNNQNPEAMLGYEIRRNGTPVAFVTADKTEYIDTIETANNKVITYEIVGIDKLLNRTETTTLEPIKVSHDGSISKENWTIETSLISDKDTVTGTENDSCTQTKVSAIDTIKNNDYTDSYEGKTTNNKGEIIVSLGEVKPVVALKYKAGTGRPIGNYEIYISKDKENWEEVKQGKFNLESLGEQIVYFNKENDTWLYTYDASYIKLVITNQAEVSISEIDILGQSGDNVELLENGIGKLKEDYRYGLEQYQLIPKGSVIFTGEYKGNPSYNVVKLLDENNQIIEGEQIILANVPEKGELGEVSSGTWIYWIEPEQLNTLPEKVRAELYRVDDAHTNVGERLVSDTLLKIVPKELQDIEIKAK